MFFPYENGYVYLNERMIPDFKNEIGLFYQISFNKMTIYGAMGSGINFEAFKSVDSIQLLYNSLEIFAPEFLPLITKLTNNRITADEFWAEVPPFEELN